MHGYAFRTLPLSTTTTRSASGCWRCHDAGGRLVRHCNTAHAYAIVVERLNIAVSKFWCACTAAERIGAAFDVSLGCVVCSEQQNNSIWAWCDQHIMQPHSKTISNSNHTCCELIWCTGASIERRTSVCEFVIKHYYELDCNLWLDIIEPSNLVLDRFWSFSHSNFFLLERSWWKNA